MPSDQNQNNSQNELNNTWKSSNRRATIPNEKSPNNTDNQSTNMQEPNKPSWWIANQGNIREWVLLICTMILAVYTGGLFYLTSNQMEIVKESVKAANKSADAAIAAQRPWISVNVKIDSSLKITEKGINIDLTFNLVNSGNTPAINVHVIPQLVAVPIRDSLDFKAGIKKAIEFSDNWDYSKHSFGRTIFPNKFAIERHNVHLHHADVINAIAVNNNTEPKRIILNLGGCVDYTFGGGNGRTTFNFVLMIRNTDHMGIDIHPRIIASNQIILQEQIIGVYAN